MVDMKLAWGEQGDSVAVLANAEILSVFDSRVVGYSDLVPGNSALRFDADPVVNGGSNALLAAEVSLGRLN